jgi:AcrR family transcriptional regulator
MSPADRREAIISAALQVMITKGLASTTVRDVAERMGTSSGLIHHYFASMDDLLAAAFERAAEADLTGLRAAMATGDGVLARLRIFFDNYTRADQDWAFQLWLDAWAEAGRRPAVRATSQRLNIAWQQLLAESIRAGVAEGVLSCPDPEGAGWRILSLLDGLALQAVAHRVAIDRDDVVRWSVAHAEGELGLPAGSLRRSSGPGRPPGPDRRGSDRK